MKRPEQTLHMAVVAHLRQRGAPGVVFLHPANGVRFSGRKAHVQGAIAKGMGVRAGASDLLLWHKGKSFALELKAPGGTLTRAQIAFILDMHLAGVTADCVVGLDAALNWLELQGLLRGRVA